MRTNRSTRRIFIKSPVTIGRTAIIFLPIKTFTSSVSSFKFYIDIAEQTTRMAIG